VNIALNLVCGGEVLEHIEIRRTDAAFLDALGARAIPDPTTAGDYLRRFDEPAKVGWNPKWNCGRRITANAGLIPTGDGTAPRTSRPSTAAGRLATALVP
jgi:hypothetical protein